MTFKISSLITTIWFCFMTYLSHQNGEGTAELSVGIVEKIIKCFGLINYYNEIHIFLRHLAHIIVFAILVILVLFTLSQKWKSRKIFVTALLFITSWTWGDEITKVMIPGRHFSWRDVLLNFLGVTVGTMIFKFIETFYITEELLTNGIDFYNIELTEKLFKQYLHQIKLNYKRTVSCPEGIKKVIFFSSKKLLEDRFKSFLKNSKGIDKKLVKSLLENDYGKYCFICKYSN